jgi:hypothetical protein
MFHPSALDLAETLEEISEGPPGLGLGKRAGTRPILLIVDGGLLWYPKIRDAEKGTKLTAASRARASELAPRQIPATVRAFENSSRLVEGGGVHREIAPHHGLSVGRPTV